MPDTAAQRSPASRGCPPPSVAAFDLEAEMVPAAGRQDALGDALRLLAIWAVRAARAQAEGTPNDTDRKGTGR